MKVALLHYTNEFDKTLYMPLGVYYLKSYAEHNCRFSHDISVVLDSKEIPHDAEVVGISALSQDFGEVIRLCDELAAQGHTVLLGGYHISYLPHTLPVSARAGALFEGEESFSELLDALADENRGKHIDLSTIRGIVYREEGQLHITRSRPLIRPLDGIPFPSRSSVPRPDWSRKQPIFSSRGCPYECAFCASSAFWKTFRAFSAEYVVAEIEDIIQKHPKVEEITFVDDLFTADRPRMRKISKSMEERGLRGKLRINCSIRADSVDDELCEILSALKSNFIYFGLESTSPRILKALKDKGSDPSCFQNALETLHRNGLPVSVTLISGSSDETESELRDTYEFVASNMRSGRIEEVGGNILSPMPGTRIWRELVCKSDESSFSEWTRLRFYSYIHTQTQNLMPFRTWTSLRKTNKSFLVNETMKDDELYEIMEQYDKQIKNIFAEKILKKKFDLSGLPPITSDDRVLITGCDATAYALASFARNCGAQKVHVCTDEAHVHTVAEIPVIRTDSLAQIKSSITQSYITSSGG